MVYSLTYRRPPHVDSAQASVLGDEKTKSISEATIDSTGFAGISFGVPDALSFDRIIAGATCPVSVLCHSSIKARWPMPVTSADFAIALGSKNSDFNCASRLEPNSSYES